MLPTHQVINVPFHKCHRIHRVIYVPFQKCHSSELLSWHSPGWSPARVARKVKNLWIRNANSTAPYMVDHKNLFWVITCLKSRLNIFFQLKWGWLEEKTRMYTRLRNHRLYIYIDNIYIYIYMCIYIIYGHYTDPQHGEATSSFSTGQFCGTLIFFMTWWYHNMNIFFTLLALCEENQPISCHQLISPTQESSKSFCFLCC